MLNQVIITGRIANDPEVIVGENNKKRISYSFYYGIIIFVSYWLFYFKKIK